MVQCAVAGCKKDNRKNTEEISFHTFPNKNSDKRRYDIWVEKCKRKYVEPGFEKKKWEPAKGALMCGLHFDFDAFEKHPIVAFSCNVKTARPRLKKDAIPTKFWYHGEAPPTKSPSKLYNSLRPVEKKSLLRELLNNTNTDPSERVISDHETEVTSVESRLQETDDTIDSTVDDDTTVDDEPKIKRPKITSSTEDNKEAPGTTKVPNSQTVSTGTETVQAEIPRTTFITVPCAATPERRKTYVKTTQTKKLQTAQRSTQYLVSDFGGLKAEEEKNVPEVKETGVQCTIIGGPLFLDEEDSTDDDDEIVYSDNPDDDPDWLPGDDDSTDSEEELEEVEDTIEPDVSPIKERKYIVFQSCLLALFAICIECFSKCRNTVFSVGTLIKVKSMCDNGHVREWCSGPVLNRMPVGNLCVTAAAYFSGCSTVKTLNLFKSANISSISTNTYYRLQKHYIIPAVNSVWMLTQAGLLEERRNRPVKLAGDGRCCSPGHTAKYGSYSLMDAESGQILSIQLVQSNEVPSSYHMELEGLKRGVSYLTEQQLQITDIITDRHCQVRKWLRTDHPEIQHWFDVWHISKSVKKKLDKIAKKPKCEVVAPWIKSISNHLYWCAASSGGNKQMVVEKWLSIERHITNVHEGHGELFPRCLHGDIDRNWIGKETKAHKELKAVIQSTRLKNDIEQLSSKEQTSSLEAFHKIVCYFASKHGHFFYESMEAKLLLAALHFNENVNKAQAVTAEGVPRWKLSYPKYKKGKEVVTKVTTKVTYDYVDDLMDAVWSLRTTFKTVKEAKAQLIRPAVSIPGYTTDKVNKVDKEEAVKNFRSRFSSK